MKKLNLLTLCVCTLATVYAKPTQEYYKTTVNGLNGRSLELALAGLIYPHAKVSYENLWNKYPSTDLLPEGLLANPDYTDQVYDMYADWKNFPKYYSAHNGETDSQLHSQTGGFNREHVVPNSWWGGEDGNAIAYTDLHHLVPADGCANNAKGDFPLGEYAAGFNLFWPKENKISTMGNNTSYIYVEADNTPDHSGSWSHVWSITANANGYGGGAAKVWEPKDEFKGDFARMYLYVVCAYEEKLTWKTNYMFTTVDNHTVIKPWALELLLNWHRQDPVSQKELDRNDAVYVIQNNRNPFIDYPELVEYIWGDKTTETFDLSTAWCAYDPKPEQPNDPATPEEPAVKADAPFYFPHIAHVGTPFNAPRLTTKSDGALRYSSSNPEVATIDPESGEVTIVAPGTAIITVVQAESDSYKEASASYMIKVLD